MPQSETNSLLSSIFELLFSTGLGWVLLLGAAVRVGIAVYDARYNKRPNKNKARRRGKNPSLFRQYMALVIPGTFVLVVFWLIDGSVNGWFLAAVLAAWAVAAIWWQGSKQLKRRKLRRKQTLAEINALSPDEFEELVADIFRRRGSKAEVVGAIGDHGIDIIVTGRDGTKALVQCKRYGEDRWVGEREIRDLYGTLMADEEASVGYLVTTGFFSQAAREWAEGKLLKLIDGDGLEFEMNNL